MSERVIGENLLRSLFALLTLPVKRFFVSLNSTYSIANGIPIVNTIGDIMYLKQWITLLNRGDNGVLL